ncbi:MAG: dehydrogenase E1 component subunit alpha/beta [Gemmatimonadetes bacterium]|nr:dehydrogenase E1 component subunit alpha/beta [Gemmatimonadota bacterium]
MATKEREITETRDSEGPSSEWLLEAYRTMVTSRRVDDREISLNRQNKTFFQISCAGHEAVQVAMADHLRPGYDWFHPYYRDRALVLALGQTPLDHLLGAIGASDDPNSAGRQMPSHFSDPGIHIVTMSSPTGTQFLQAVGAAEAGYRIPLIPELQGRIEDFEEDEVVLVCSGEGATSGGEFWEALNTACNLKLPVVFLIEDNEYAISVPVEVNTAGGSISKLVSGFPDLFIIECDGTDVLDSHRATGKAVRHCRLRRGPALVHCHTIRPYSHSLSDDERIYRPAAELEEAATKDPLLRTRNLLMERGVATAEELDRLEEEVKTDVAAAAVEASSRPQPEPETALLHLYSEEVDPTSESFDTEDSPDFGDGRALTMVDLLNACLQDEMERDPRIVLFGQDIADASREGALDEVKGKGGVFKVTHGLQRRFGGTRVFNAPLAEANIVGRAIGMAQRGLRPIIEIQFFDYIWPAFQQIRNELATIRYRSHGQFSAPVVIRVPYGGYLRGGGPYHSQTGETLFTHTPGLRVVLPSSALEANGLLRTAIRCDDPVIFLEHKHLYRQVHNKSRYPGKDFMIPLGKANLIREGSDLTIVTCGALVKRSMDAAKIASEEHGIECDVIDLRTLSPLDMDTVAHSVKKTNKVLITHEDSLSWGLGSEIAALIADELFPWLDGPVRRVASLDTWVAYAPQLEDEILPQSSDVLAAMLDLASY